MKKLFKILLCAIIGLGFVPAFAQQPAKQAPTEKNKTTVEPQSATRAYLSLSRQQIDFGVIPKGEKKVIEVSFTNTGVKPLILTDAYVNCGCTSIDFPKEPFMPGKSGKLKISYDADEEGFFNKTITLFSNAENKKETIKIQGIVSED
ncbi:MAG: DUF1573 domain-containing protein [Bacteroidales bacterium]|nr:DUF1573 domain-containing protein [Bacteroidales bacterium]